VISLSASEDGQEIMCFFVCDGQPVICHMS
jgi:hypothetical protein